MAKQNYLALLALLLLAFALRVYRLDSQSLWYDEAVTAKVASQGIGELTRWTADDIQPPLYYYAVAGWMRLAGRGEWALRFPSAFFGTLTVPLMWAVALRLFGRGRSGRVAALAAALLTALSPLYVYYAQEARMYTQLTFLGLLAGYALLRATKDEGRRTKARDALRFVLRLSSFVRQMVVRLHHRFRRPALHPLLRRLSAGRLRRLFRHRLADCFGAGQALLADAGRFCRCLPGHRAPLSALAAGDAQPVRGGPLLLAGRAQDQRGAAACGDQLHDRRAGDDAGTRRGAAAAVVRRRAGRGGRRVGVAGEQRRGGEEERRSRGDSGSCLLVYLSTRPPPRRPPPRLAHTQVQPALPDAGFTGVSADFGRRRRRIGR